jgi:hypothetical protein
VTEHGVSNVGVQTLKIVGLRENPLSESASCVAALRCLFDKKIISFIVSRSISIDAPIMSINRVSLASTI